MAARLVDMKVAMMVRMMVVWMVALKVVQLDVLSAGM